MKTTMATNIHPVMNERRKVGIVFRPSQTSPTVIWPSLLTKLSGAGRVHMVGGLGVVEDFFGGIAGFNRSRVFAVVRYSFMFWIRRSDS